MTTWAQPIRHPWFDRSPLKRKLSSADDERRSSPFQRPSSSPTSHAKRRKFNTLEHGFAHLSLASAQVHPNSSGPLITPIVYPAPPSSAYSTFPPAGVNVILPGSIEEPLHQLETLVPEVGMECEDEREFLSDTPMDSDIRADHERKLLNGASGSTKFSISTPFLESLRKRQAAPQPIIPIFSPSIDFGALVLYRPLRPPSPNPSIDKLEEVVTPDAAALLETSAPAPIDDDAMDVE